MPIISETAISARPMIELSAMRRRNRGHRSSGCDKRSYFTSARTGIPRCRSGAHCRPGAELPEPAQHLAPRCFCVLGVIARAVVGVEAVFRIRKYDQFVLEL